MHHYGEIIEARITDQNDQAYFVQADGVTYRLNKSECSETMNVTDVVEGFAYENMHHEKCFTTDIPEVRKGTFGWAEVVAVRKDLGVFVNIGLIDKDIVVSLDDMPEGNEYWPKKGDQLFISLRVDAKNRMWGVLGIEENLKPLFKSGSPDMMNINVKGRVYRVLNVGVQAISDAHIPIFIHASEMINPLRLGQTFEGRVIDYHKKGGTLNVSTKPRAYEAIDDDAAMIQAILEKAPDHFLPLHDKSHPMEISNYLGISKGQFKRAVGNLLKNQSIRQEKGKGIYLIKEGSENGQ